MNKKVTLPAELGLIPLRNFGILFSDMKLYRSAQPEHIYEFEWMKTVLGINTLVNLRAEIDIDHHLGKIIPFCITIPVKDHEPPTIQQAMQFYHLMKQCPKPLLFHCEHGRGRTSTFSVIAKMSYGGMSFDDAMKDERTRFHYQWQHHSQEDFLHQFNKHIQDETKNSQNNTRRV